MKTNTDTKYAEIQIPPGMCLLLYNNWPAYCDEKQQDDTPIDNVFILPGDAIVAGFGAQDARRHSGAELFSMEPDVILNYSIAWLIERIEEYDGSDMQRVGASFMIFLWAMQLNKNAQELFREFWSGRGIWITLSKIGDQSTAVEAIQSVEFTWGFDRVNVKEDLEHDVTESLAMLKREQRERTARRTATGKGRVLH